MRSRLMALVAFCALLLVTVLAAPAVLMIRDSTIRAVDDDLMDVAQALGVFLLSAPPMDEAAAFADTLAEGTPVTFSVIDDEGRTFGDDRPDHPVGLTGAHAGQRRSDPSDLIPTVTVSDGFRVARVAFHNGSDAGVVLANYPETSISTTVWERLGVLALATVTALGLALAAAWILAGRLTRSVGAAVQTAEQLGDGVRDVAVPDGGPPELQALGRAHSRLAGQIDDLLHRERLRSAEISHRLRTPLTAVELATERVVAGWPGVADSAEGRALLTRLKDLEDELDQVILETKAAAADGPAPVIDLASTIRTSLQFWLPMADQQCRYAVVDLPDSTVPVRLPEADVFTAFDTMIGNVFRHTEQGVGFEVSVRAVDDRAELRIADQGAGRVISSPAGRSTGSTGMGRVVAAAIAGRAGGTLTITSDKRGTTVVLALPLGGPVGRPFRA